MLDRRSSLRRAPRRLPLLLALDAAGLVPRVVARSLVAVEEAAEAVAEEEAQDRGPVLLLVEEAAAAAAAVEEEEEVEVEVELVRPPLLPHPSPAPKHRLLRPHRQSRSQHRQAHRHPQR